MFDFQMVRIGLSSVKSATSNVFSFSPPSPLVSNPVFADYCWSSTIPLFLLVHSHFRWSHLRLMFQRWSSKIYMLQSDIILVEVSICLDNREHFCLKKRRVETKQSLRLTRMKREAAVSRPYTSGMETHKPSQSWPVGINHPQSEILCWC